MSGEAGNVNQASVAAPEGAELLGELHPLLAQLGCAEGLLSLSGAAALLQCPRVESRQSLAGFLRAYYDEILLPEELPAICRAYAHAAHNQVMELVSLDREVSRQARPQPLARASRRVGQAQLKRLRPLRSERVVQRYLNAVEQGRAQGWHTLVYGLTLAVYSLPVRQGLLNYTRQTLFGFIYAVARPLQLGEADCRNLLDELCADLPKRLETLLSEACPRG